MQSFHVVPTLESTSAVTVEWRASSENSKGLMTHPFPVCPNNGISAKENPSAWVTFKAFSSPKSMPRIERSIGYQPTLPGSDEI